MADVMNIYAESGRNIIGDDSTPTLTLENTSSGAVLQLQNAGGTGPQLSLLSCPTTSIYMKGATKGLEVYTGKTGIQTGSTGGFGLAVLSCPTTSIFAYNTATAAQLGSTGGLGLSVLSCPTTSIYAMGSAGGAYIRSAASEGIPVVLDRSIVGSATVALLKLSVLSTASAPLFDFGTVSSTSGGVVSTASACATLDYAVRVKIGDNYGWIPVYRAVA